MRRRDFIALFGGTAAACSGAWPLAARAQQSAAPLVGVLAAGSPSGFWAEMFTAFRQGLGEVGYSEGRNMAIEALWAEDHYDRLPALAADLIGHRPAVIGAFATPAAKAAKAATTTIPVVFGTIADPVQIGLVASLNHPGGNMTGVTLLSVEVGPKLLELLHNAVPAAAIMALLVNPTNPNASTQVKTVQQAASTLGLQIQILNVSTIGEIDATFANLGRERPDALFVTGDAFFTSRRGQFTTLMAVNKIPATYSQRDFVEAGGLMSYGTDIADAFHQVGVYIGSILKGAKPADLPVLQATKFEFAINLETARALGIEVPSGVLSIADEVIE